MISAQCSIEACNARVHGDVKCREHGGDPFYEWRTSDFGEATYYVKQVHQEGHHGTSTR